LRVLDPPARSYYAASAAGTDGQSPAARPSLEGELAVDIGIVGGGIAGCSAALHLAERGYRVALLEANTVGYGGSGRSGGQTIFGLAVSQEKLIAQLGPEDARRVFDFSIEALELTQSLIKRYAIACDYRPNHLHVAVKARQARELENWAHELRDQYHYRSVSYLGRAELAAHVRSERFHAGLLDTRSGHLHPLKYTQGLARAAESQGARIFEHSCALKYSGGLAAGDEVRLQTGTGALRCQHLVLCGNAYLGPLAPALARRVLGVGTYIIATEPLAPAHAAELLPSNAAVADINWILDYFRLSADWRLLFGGRVSYSSIQPPRLVESMRERMVRVFPSLRDVKVDYAWGGLLDITMSRAPDFGRLAPNVFYAQGFSGHGMTLTAMAGRLIAEAIAGTAERFDVFSRIPHRDFPGGALLRRPSLMLAMLYYRLKDLL
jgi:gamma-glutamylputrescine oxidase